MQGGGAISRVLRVTIGSLNRPDGLVVMCDHARSEQDCACQQGAVLRSGREDLIGKAEACGMQSHIFQGMKCLLAGFETFFATSPKLLVDVVQTWRTHCADVGLGATARRGLMQFALAACHSKERAMRHLFARDLLEWMQLGTADRLMALEVIGKCGSLGRFNAKCRYAVMWAIPRETILAETEEAAQTYMMKSAQALRILMPLSRSVPEVQQALHILRGFVGGPDCSRRKAIPELQLLEDALEEQVHKLAPEPLHPTFWQHCVSFFAMCNTPQVE